MTAPSVTSPSVIEPPSTLTRCVQGGLLVMMPATLAVLGGPAAIWSNGGYMVRIVLASSLLPSAVCGAAALENLIRTVIIATKDLINSGCDIKELKNDVELSKEVKRLTGMSRAALLPISGWAVLSQMPVYDYYIYAIPMEGLIQGTTKACEGIKFVAVRVDKVLKAIKFWDALEVTCDYTVIPTFYNSNKT